MSSPDCWGLAMLARWVAIALIVVFLVLAGVIAGTAILGQTPTATGQSSAAPVLGAGTERVTGTAGLWRVTAELTRGAANEVTIVIKADSTIGETIDQGMDVYASLRMLDMAMGTEPIPLAPERVGQWRGVGSISMNGRWALEVTIDRDIVELPFEVVAP
jgi:hypothetical protein